MVRSKKRICAMLMAAILLGQACPVFAADEYKTGFDPIKTAYKPVNVTPNVKPYSINPDLSNIANIGDFSGLSKEQKEKIAKNGFVVTPSNREQIFFIYEANDYENKPSFVTTDSILQVYHVFFDYALRTSEAEEFKPKLDELTLKMINTLKSDYAKATDTKVKAAVVKSIAYFGVAAKLTGLQLPSGLPAEATTLINNEVKLVEGQKLAMSPIFDVEVDYSQFIPRGHYTKSELLKSYFKSMMWYGLIPFSLYQPDGSRDDAATLNALVVTNALFTGQSHALWEAIYSPTCFFVGNADDYTPFQYKSIMDKVYGKSVDINKLADKESLDAFYTEADKLPKPQINAKFIDPKGKAVGASFKFMGQRYIPDSEILQELSQPIVRPVPTGLDVFAVLGSKRAEALLEAYPPAINKWDGYEESFQKLNTKFANLSEETWRSNLYYGWLWTLKSLTGGYGDGYPAFMRNTAWQDKSTATALGSWAELRHDTILYGKQSTAEMGGGERPEFLAYVEPNAEVYNKLLWLTKYTRENLSARGMLNEKLDYTAERFEETIQFLLDCSIKELKGENLNSADRDRLRTYGGTLEYLTCSMSEGNPDHWYLIESETDRNMAVIADVHTVLDTGQYLKAAVGKAAGIYVAVPIDGKIYLARGGVFDYYEFLSTKRLTDEEWQKMIETKTTPARPAWVSSFMTSSR